MLATFIRSIIIYIIVLIVMRLMGKREIGQMQPFELAISIMIADLASIPMTDIGIPIRFQLVELFLVCRGYFRSSSGHRRFVRFLSRSHFLRRHVLRLEQGKPSFSSGFHLDGIHRFQHFRFVDPGSECVDAKPGRHGIQPDDSPQRNVGFLGGTTLTDSHE